MVFHAHIHSSTMESSRTAPPSQVSNYLLGNKQHLPKSQMEWFELATEQALRRKREQRNKGSRHALPINGFDRFQRSNQATIKERMSSPLYQRHDDVK